MAVHGFLVEDDKKILWGYREVAEALGVDERSIRRMVLDGRFPPPIEAMLPRVKWAKATVKKWAEGN